MTRSLRRLLLAALALLSLGAVGVGLGVYASSAAGMAPRGASRTPSAASTRASIATLLEHGTGYTPSQVTTRAACGTGQAGAMGCDAELLVSKSTGATIHPLAIGSQTGATSQPSSTTTQAGPDAYSPSFLQEAYDTGWLSANDGSGETVAIVDAYSDPTAKSDLADFRSAYGLPTISTSACSKSTITSHDVSGMPCMVEVSETGGSTSRIPTDPTGGGWDVEESLDLDAVSSICPNCNILFIETDSDQSNDLAAGNAEALELGAKIISDSWGELDTAADDDDYFTTTDDATGLVSGTEVFAATGDDGAYVDGDYDGQTSDSETQYPASEPDFTAVGGTSVEPASNARGYTETAWSGAGSGCATDQPEPSWQADADTGCDGRALADVSADADPDTGLDVYDSNGGSDGFSGWDIVGGTSLATPLTAAYTALTDANANSTANSDGSLSAEWAYADALNDVTSGNDGSCPSGTASQICDAGTGWDGPTGVGSIAGDVLSGGPSLTTPPSDQLTEPDVTSVGDDDTSGLAALTSTSATLEGGAYPNGSTTYVWWEYGTAGHTSNGTDFSSASQTAEQSVGSGTAPALASPQTVSLSADTTYYLEECAENSSGEVCGNEVSFTTPADAALAADTSDPPVITDTDPSTAEQVTVGDTLSVSTGGWYNASGVTFTYQWYLDGSPIDGATGNTYTLTAAAANQSLYARVTATTTTSVSADSADVTVEPLNTPQASAAPQIDYTSLGLGGQLSIETPGRSPTPTSVSYQWQESSDDANWSNLGAATSSPSTYTIAASDSGEYIQVAITATNAAGSTTVYANPVQVTSFGSATTTGTTAGTTTSTPTGSTTGTTTSPTGTTTTVSVDTPSLRGGSTVGSKISVSTSEPSGETVVFERCAHRCTIDQRGSSTSYTLRPADAGYFVIAEISDGGGGGDTVAGMVGPVRGPMAGALKITGAGATLKTGKRTMLLTVKRTITRPKGKKGKPSTYRLALKRNAKLKGSLHAWACLLKAGQLVSCTVSVSVVHAATLTEIVAGGETVELIAVT